MLYQISNAIDTIPSTSAAAIALNPKLVGTLAGTVTSNTTNPSILFYSGSNDVGKIYRQSKVAIIESVWWIFINQTFVDIPTTPLLARVTGCTQNANNNWSIFLDRPYPGLTAQGSLFFLRGPAWHSTGNDGAVAIKYLDGEKGSEMAAIPVGDSISVKGYQLNAQNIKYYAPVYIDATGGAATVECQI